MAGRVKMPQLGESVAEGTIGKWLKQPGEQVARDEPLVEVMTDKVNVEVESTHAGVLEQILVAEGETVPVGADIAVIADGSSLGNGSGAPQPTTAGAADAAASVAEAEKTAVQPVAASGQEVTPPASARHAPAQEPPSTPDADSPRFYTPVVMRMAREHGIDLSQVRGSGLGGRVTKKDLEAIVQAGPPAPAASAPAAAPVQMPTPAEPTGPAASRPESRPSAPSEQPDEEHVPLSPIRRAIADHMLRSVQTSPHAWSMVEVDVTEIVRLRAGLKEDWQRREGFELTYLPFVLKAVAESLRDHPTLNSSWAADHVVLKRRINLGIAVATEDALIVPVIKDADRLSLVGLARELRALAQKARAGKLTVDEVRGGTFTVNNTGALGSILSQPIINQPQAAIMTTEAIVKRPFVVAGDAIAIRSIMNVCCSFDHRILDGAQALRFLAAVKQRLESYRADTSVL